MKDDFGDRLKAYESVETDRKAMPWLPLCVRLDGKGFSKWTRNLKRPYDERLSKLMCDVTKRMVAVTDAKVGYTQSDEISLILMQDENNFASQHWFDGKIQKLTSVICSEATAYFNDISRSYLGDAYPGLATFDCRVWNVPNKDEAANTILWREKDATKNSISMAARHYYSHTQLHLKTSSEMQEMLFQKGVNWNDYPAFFKRGTFIQVKRVSRPLNEEELARIPEQHRKALEKVDRRDIVEVDMLSFTKVTNRVAVVFDGAEPTVKTVRHVSAVESQEDGYV
jgi:tRNA(His) 5'-end guanylyltransferase